MTHVSLVGGAGFVKFQPRPLQVWVRNLVILWFLLGTGRMPHPVGGAMGVARGHTRSDIISLNIHKATSRWYCMAVVL